MAALGKEKLFNQRGRDQFKGARSSSRNSKLPSPVKKRKGAAKRSYTQDLEERPSGGDVNETSDEEAESQRYWRHAKRRLGHVTREAAGLEEDIGVNATQSYGQRDLTAKGRRIREELRVGKKEVLTYRVSRAILQRNGLVDNFESHCDLDCSYGRRFAKALADHNYSPLAWKRAK